MDYAREGDAIVVVGIDRLGRNAAEVMTTIRDLGERGIVLRSIREGIDTSNATGRMVAGVLASLAELELELARAPHGSAGRKAGTWAIYRSPEGIGPVEGRSGATDAHKRRVGEHNRIHSRRITRDRLSGSSRGCRRVNQSNEPQHLASSWCDCWPTF